MTVVFDLVGVQNRDHGERGIARYVLNLALQIERLAPGLVDRYLVRPELPVPGTLEPLITTGRVTRSSRDRSHVDTRRGGVFVAGSLFELHEPLDSVLPRPYRDPAWTRMAVLYDLIPLRFPDLYLSNPDLRHPYLGRVEAVKAMDHLLAISAATAADAAEFLGHGPDRVTVIGAGADARFCPHPNGREAARRDVAERPPVPGLRPGFILNPSGIELRKNIDRLLEAYATLDADVRRRHQLVLMCKTSPDEAAVLAATAARLGIAEDLLVTGFVSDEDLVRLNRAAHVVVFPSLYEGFGLPVLEAMRCGAPAICSDSSSLREVQTDPAARFDPTDTAAIADALSRVLTDDAERRRIEELRPPPFTWERAAALTIDEIERARSKVRAALGARVRRPRIAVVTPLAPQRSGIATYAARMLEHLRAHADCTVFVDEDVDGVDPIDGVAVERTSCFHAIDSAGRPFDRVVTFLGNSHFHVDALQLIKDVGGTVLLHDARLTGLYGVVAERHPERLVEGSVGRTAGERYPHRYRAAVHASRIVDPAMAVQSGIHLLAEVVAAADQVLVHSEHAANLTELDTGVRPTVVFPIPCRPPSRRAGEPTSGPDGTNIVSVGLVSPTKRPELLVAAVAELRRSVPTATLTFVGGCPDDYRRHLDTVIADHGLTGAVTLTGHVDDTAFAAALDDAVCAVQLRDVTNGESSAAVADALSAGVPLVVTALGAAAELPADAVQFVAPEIEPAELAATLAELIDDAPRRRAMRAAGLEHAAEQSFAAAARRLLEVLELPS